jgi:hypothetical protein
VRRRNGPRDVRRQPGDASPRSAPDRAGSDQQYPDATALPVLLTSALLNGARRDGDVAPLGMGVEPPSVLRRAVVHQATGMISAQLDVSMEEAVLRLRAHAYSSERAVFARRWKGMIGMARERRLAEIFVEVADSLVEDFDVIDLLHRLSARCVELLDVAAAGILLADAHGELQITAAIPAPATAGPGNHHG